jgi:hypothetical protein
MCLFIWPQLFAVSCITRWSSMCANAVQIVGQLDLAYALVCNTTAAIAIRMLSEVKFRFVFV